MLIKNHVGMKGLFKLKALNKNNEVTRESKWIPNLILNSGLNKLSYTSGYNVGYLERCFVGTGSSTPIPTQIALDTLRATTTTKVSASIITGVTGTDPFYGFCRQTFRFDIGVAAGNLTEVGMGTTTNTGVAAELFSRALILDDFQNPTTFTVLGDEYLEVTYELRCYPRTTDVIINDVFSTPTTSHTVTIRPYSSSSNFILGYQFVANRLTSGYGSTGTLYTGSLAPITSSPTGSFANSSATSLVYQAYITDSHNLTGSMTWLLDRGNSPTIRTCLIATGMGNFQVGFEPPLQKTSNDILRIDFQISWGNL